MFEKPAARATDPTVCKRSGHGESPIVSGSADVFIEGLPAARFGDQTQCGSTIVGGNAPTVFINGRRAAVVGSEGSHGNTVTAGAGTVIFGNTHTPVAFVPVKPLSFGDEFSRSFQFVTEQGVAQNLEYRLRAESGDEVAGFTCGLGKTKFLFTGEAAERIAVYVASM